jgi:heptosyltransferase-1/heptosyltransferase-2
VEYKNILIIKMSSLGDVIHALPFAGALRERFPHSRITWLVHPQFGAFVPDPPVVDEVLYFDKKAYLKMNWKDKLRKLREMKHLLHSCHFDLVIDLQGLFKSAVMAYLTGCPNRIGYGEMREGSGLISKAIVGPHIHDHVIERYLDVARYLGAKVDKISYPMPALKEQCESIKQRLIEAGMPDKNPLPYVVMAPGARWETKQWPVEHYAELALKFAKDDWYVVLAGGPDDCKKGERIWELTGYNPHIIDFIGHTNLRELGALIKMCRFYVSGDTGPLHIAAAYGKNLIAIYGPTRPDRTGPYGDLGAVILTSPESCAGCLKKHCDHWTCMGHVTPDDVYRIFQEKEAESHD